jgi:hypothetical protein
MMINRVVDDFHLQLKEESRVIMIETLRRRINLWRREGKRCLYPVANDKGTFKGFIEAKSITEAKEQLSPGERLWYAPDGFIYPILVIEYGTGEHCV